MSHHRTASDAISFTVEDLFKTPEKFPKTGHYYEKIVSLSGTKDRIQDQGQSSEHLDSVVLVAGGYRAIVTSWGARLLSFKGPDGIDIVVGPRNKQAILTDTGAMGAVVGRVANRIGNGRLVIPHQGTYQLPCNDGPHHLHGGPHGYHQRLWRITRLFDSLHATEHKAEVILSLSSPDGDQGYPGDVRVEVCYELTSKGVLTIRLVSHVASASTPVNLTHHAYWNLDGGEVHGTCLRNMMFTPYALFLPTDVKHLPTGEILSVDKTAFDFRVPKAFGSQLPQPTPQSPVGGYDVYLTASEQKADPLQEMDTEQGDIDRQPSKVDAATMPLLARILDTAARRTLEVYSDQPGFQLYTGNYLRDSYVQYQGFCIEPSGFIDAVNHPQFPSILAHPGATVRQSIRCRLVCG